MCVFVRVFAFVCARVRTCMRTNVRARVFIRLPVRARVRVRVSMRLCNVHALSPTYSHVVYFDLNSRRQIRSEKIGFINNSNSKTRNSFRFILEIGPNFFFNSR